MTNVPTTGGDKSASGYISMPKEVPDGCVNASVGVDAQLTAGDDSMYPTDDGPDPNVISDCSALPV